MSLKLRVSILVRPDKRKLMNDPTFDGSLNRLEKCASEALKAVVTNFLDSQKSDNNEALVEKLLTAFEKQGCLVSLRSTSFMDAYLLSSHSILER